MKDITKRFGKRRIALLVLLLAVFMVRIFPHAGEAYAVSVYPRLSAVVSGISSVVPFSLDEWIVIGAVVIMVTLPFRFLRSRSWTRIAVMEAEVVMWMTVWFYIGWGMNYFRDSVFQRVKVERKNVDKAEFLRFLNGYTDSLNATYIPLNSVDEEKVRLEIKNGFRSVPQKFALCHPHDYQQPKVVFFNFLYSSVGVLGYMGPFADESHLNDCLFPQQYAFVYAHELAHLLSVSSEAEANFWAYHVCTRSDDREIRYSGYYGILPNVFRNAMAILTEDEFKTWRKTIKPCILNERRLQQEFWHEQYSPLLGTVQDWMFNALLKSNRIPDGKKNYDQVLSMIMSLDNRDE